MRMTGVTPSASTEVTVNFAACRRPQVVRPLRSSSWRRKAARHDGEPHGELHHVRRNRMGTAGVLRHLRITRGRLDRDAVSSRALRTQRADPDSRVSRTTIS